MTSSTQKFIHSSDYWKLSDKHSLLNPGRLCLCFAKELSKGSNKSISGKSHAVCLHCIVRRAELSGCHQHWEKMELLAINIISITEMGYSESSGSITNYIILNITLSILNPIQSSPRDFSELIFVVVNQLNYSLPKTLGKWQLIPQEDCSTIGLVKYQHHFCGIYSHFPS